MISIVYALATCCGAGHFPLGPGTFTSALTVLALWFLPNIPLWAGLAGLPVLTGIGVWAADVTARRLGQHDPSIVVIDEVVGMYIALLGLPAVWWVYLLAFISFRIFDIAKPYPIRLCEQLPGGWGIVMDDVVAGIFARVVVGLILLFTTI